jgi:hypothetical protein
MTAIGRQCIYRAKKDGMCGYHLMIMAEQPYRLEERKLRNGLKAHLSILKRRTHRLKRRRILIDKGLELDKDRKAVEAEEGEVNNLFTIMSDAFCQ